MIEIGIMGGSFNPIHTRHLMVAQCALDQFRLQKVIIVPSGAPPHKIGMLDGEPRFVMCVVAVADNSQMEVSRTEIDRPGVTWSIDTLKEFKRLLGDGVRLNFIIGEDNIEVLKNYDRRDELLALCRLLVSPRGCIKRGMVKRWRRALPGADLEGIDCPADARSSTLIRKWIGEGKSVRYLVPPAVYKILEEKGYYRDASQPSTPVSAPSRKRRRAPRKLKPAA
jgi:nicotinate-nucleotide adenylyltransferase